MRMEIAKGGHAAYIYLDGVIEPGRARNQIVLPPGAVILDIGTDGKLLGVEILDPTAVQAAWGQFIRLGLPADAM